MKRLNVFIILTLTLWTSLSYAFNTSCIGRDMTVAPSNRTDSNGNDRPAWRDWKNAHADWQTRKDWSCCPTLSYNNSNRKCIDPSIMDPAIVACNGHGACGDNKGCYPQRIDDLFHESENADDCSRSNNTSYGEAYFEAQQDALEESGIETKPIGANCYRNQECQSYQCTNLKCAEKYICREASVNEVAPGAIKCEEPFKKNASNKCEDVGLPFFTGTLGTISVQQVPGEQCQFDLFPTTPGLGPEDVRNYANLGIATMRGMEWLFSTTSVPNGDDCLFTVKYMKAQAQALLAKRKTLLNKFNVAYKNIEDSYKVVNEAQKDDMTMVDTLCGDTITKHDVANRKASGIDFLCYMKVRNELFQEYEMGTSDQPGMNQIVAEWAGVVERYKAVVFSWGDGGSKDWVSFAGEKHDEPSVNRCRGGKKKKVKKRWGKRYKVKGRHSWNTMVIDRPILKNYLNLSDEGVYDFLGKKKYFLLDPLMPGDANKGVSFGNYGSRGEDADRKKLSCGNDGYKKIHDDWEPRLLEFYAGLRTDFPADQFIYEPEIPSSYETRGCASKINDPACIKLKVLVDTVKDVSMAQMLMYSAHKKRKYKDYFDKESTFRNKLFARYTTDLANLQNYYIALSSLKTKQNECIQRIVDQLKGPSFNEPNGGGIVEGGTNYYQDTQTDYLGGDDQGQNYNKPTIKQNTLRRNAFSLSSNNIKTHNSGSFKDSVGKSGASGSGNLSAGSGSLAARMAAMEEANKKAVSKGVKLDELEKEFKNNLASAGILSTSRGGGAGAASAGGLASGAGAGSTGKKATLDDELGEDKNGKDGDKVAAYGGSNPGGQAANPGGMIGGIGSGASYDSGAGTNSGLAQDPTGMSDEEKDMMEANIDRNKRAYQTNEDDSLFEVLSKTYIRNLDRILTRKKKLDDESLAGPSNQSNNSDQ